MSLFGLPTFEGIDILNSDLKQNCTKVYFLMHTSPTAEFNTDTTKTLDEYVADWQSNGGEIWEKDVSTAYYDTEGVLTFDVLIGKDELPPTTGTWIHGIILLYIDPDTSEKTSVALFQTPAIEKISGVSVAAPCKIPITSETGEVVFKNFDYATYGYSDAKDQEIWDTLNKYGIVLGSDLSNGQLMIFNPNVDASVQDKDFVYLATDGKFYPALADFTEKSYVIGMYDEPNNRIITSGVVIADITTSKGNFIYLSDTTAGKATTSVTPVRLGIALSSNAILLSGRGNSSQGLGLPYKSKLTLSSTYTVPNDYGVVVPERFEVEEGGELVIEENGVFMIVDNDQPEKVYAFDSERLGNIPAADYFNYEGATKYSTLNDAVEAVGFVNKDLLIKGNVTVDRDLTIPENVNLVFARNGKITVNSGVTLTINGGIQAGLWQIFDGNGTVTGNPKIEAVYPEWFGAKGDGVTDDTEAVRRADNFFRKVFFTNTYVITDTIIKNIYSSWYGFGFPQNRSTNTNPTIISKVDGTLIDLTQSSITRLEIEIKGVEFFSDLDSYPNAICIVAENCRSLKLENLKIRKFRQSGIRYIGGGTLFAKDIYISNCGYAWHLKNTADCWLYNCHGGTGNTKVSSYDFPDPGYGFFIENCNNINFVSARGEVSTVSGWHIVDSERLTLIGCYADNNWKNGIEIINCSKVDIISPKVFSNGNSSESINNGISVSSNNGTCSNIRIIGGFSSNEDGMQDRGINFFNLNSGTVQDVYLVGLDLGNNSAPLNGEANVTRLSVIECAGYKNISRRRKVGRVQVPIDTAGVQEVTVDCSDLEGELTVDKIITGLGAPTHSDFDGYTFPGPVDNNNKTATLKINVVTPSATTGAYTWIHYIIETI